MVNKFALMCMGFCMAISSANAAFPEKPLKLVVPFPPGGGLDMIGRPLAEAMSKHLGVQVVVENVGGAGGTIGSGRVARAEPDGYTMLLNNNAMSTSPILYPNISFDITGDLEPVGTVTDGALVLVGRKGGAAGNAQQAIALMRDASADINFATAGPGSLSYLGVSLFKNMLKHDFMAIQYKGTGPAMADLLGGRVDFLLDQLPAARFTGADIVPLAVTSKRRTRALPNVPTVSESGLPGYEVAVWQGIYVPKGTPQDRIAVINAAILGALKDDSFLKALQTMGIDAAAVPNNTPDGHRQLLRNEIQKWQPLMHAAVAQP